ncbi:FimV/HubP family polar landmark protein [Psychromonas sp.]|uniref:FimV/HubP family polar landmark protein n=1 Tax=Psychromonas sp. TaxID=1884585 RepID=UPI0039E37C64
MKRFLLTLVCCSPLVFLPSISYSIDLTGPNGEQSLSYEQYGPITSVETLWGISTKLRPDDSVSIQQTMVAIYKLNPYAFHNGNINKLIPESVIAVPTFEFVQGQTNKEAIALINKYSPRKKAKIIKPAPTPVVPEKTQVEEAQLTESIAQELQPKAAELADKKELVAAEKISDALQSELNAVKEQLLVSTETNQSLKLKLQPLQEELSAVKEQIDSELIINTKLQTIIDDYRAQLDAVEARPFSGDGWVNEILRSITSSLTNLLITIISPILVLMAVFVVIVRVRSKRLYAEQEKELAESTAILMEQTGQFDTLLTDNVSDEAEEELDFSDDLDTQEKKTDAHQEEAVNIDEDEDEDEIESIDLTESEDDAFDVVDLTEADEDETSEDDPFGIEALTDQEDLISSVKSNDSENANSEDDPFAVGAQLDEDDSASNPKVDNSQVVSTAEQADLDLAAEWEAQLANDAEGKTNDVADKDKSEADLTATSEEIDPLDSVANETVLETDLSAADELQTDLATEENELDLSESEVADIDQISDLELEIADTDDSVEVDSTEADNAQSDVLELDESLEFDASALDDLTAEPAVEETAKEEKPDLLAQQLSDVAFNADVPLPKVDSKQKDDFISIETLLENNDEHGKSEPYSEMDFDLDLDDFPDVINSEGSVDIDDDENGIGTQLDLARAYLEIDDKEGAKEILLSLVDLSNGAQRTEIDKLLARLQ